MVHAFLLVLALLGPAASQTAPAKPLPLGTIEVTGAKRLTTDQVIALSSLRVGETFDDAASARVVARLGEAGVFTAVRYETKVVDSRVGLVINVTEAAWALPVQFANFPFWTDAELTREIATELPTFDRTIPNSDAAFAIVDRVLNRLLQARGLPGHAEHMAGFDERMRGRREVFSLAGASTVVRAARFPDAAGVPAKDLDKDKIVALMVGKEFNRVDVDDLTKACLALYRRRGFLRAEAQPLQAKLLGADQQGGLELSIPIAEGPLYTWGGVEWTGATAFQPKQLDANIKIAIGKSADGDKIDAGVRAAQAMYVKKGYAKVTFTVTAAFDNAAKIVRYRIAVTEGPKTGK